MFKMSKETVREFIGGILLLAPCVVAITYGVFKMQENARAIQKIVEKDAEEVVTRAELCAWRSAINDKIRGIDPTFVLPPLPGSQPETKEASVQQQGK